LSHVVSICPAVRAQGEHNYGAWTTKERSGVPLLWHYCFECGREEWEFDEPEKTAA
jgi:hypothetical protein